MNTTELKALCMTAGISGGEAPVRSAVIAQLKAAGIPEAAIRIDRLGNLTVHRQGKARAKRKVLFSAHMDEVGMIVTDLNADGTLAFAAVGGVNPSAMAGRQVIIGDAAAEQPLYGVIGCKPVHHLSGEARKQPVALSELCIDIGTDTKEDTQRLVSRGDAVYFARHAQEFGADSLAACAIDDRFGCALLLSLIRCDLPYDTDFAFVVQEEVGLRGAAVAARTVDPEIAVVFEATTAADLPGSSGADAVCKLGGGAVISFMDGRTVYDKALYDLAADCCAKAQIPWQTKTKIAGGNDAGAIQSAGSGARVLAVSVPCRYLHAPVSVIRKSDAEACERLALALISALQETELIP